MPDTSYVTVTVTQPMRYGEAEALGLHVASMFTYPPSFDCGRPGDDEANLQLVFEDAAWGSEDDDVQQVQQILTERGLPWNTFDSAHWSWTAHEIGWKPGMEAPARREWTHSDGAPVLDPQKFHELRARLEVDDIGGRPWCLSLVDAIEAHFSDDPEGWL